MTEQEVLSRLIRILEVGGFSEKVDPKLRPYVNPNSSGLSLPSAGDPHCIDELDYAAFVVCVEQHFSVEIPEADVAQIETLNDMTLAVLERLNRAA